MEKKEAKGISIANEGGTNVLYFNLAEGGYVPSLETSGSTMGGVIDVLLENPGVGRIVFMHRRNYIYNEEQTEILQEIAKLYGYLVNQKKILGLEMIEFPGAYQELCGLWKIKLQSLVFNGLKSDPIGMYVELHREIRKEKIKIKSSGDFQEVNIRTKYLEILQYVFNMLESTALIQRVKEHTSGYSVGSRELYSRVFRPVITPDFMFTRLMAQMPLDGEIVDSYTLGEEGEVNIFKLKGEVKMLYHLTPMEFTLPEEKYEILDMARETLAKHRPSKEEFLEPDRIRKTFFNIGKGLINELAEHRGVKLSYTELEGLAKILVRYTIGFGLIEVLLKDKKIQDINVNGPIGESCLFIVHQEHDECSTNIVPNQEEGEGWATKFRILSGRPLDEANPVLDTELLLGYARARVSIMNKPLNPSGLAFAFRRHRDNPWTYPLFIKNKMINPLAAGLLSFMVDGNRSLLFAGTRGSGKTSLLGSTMVEVMKKYRQLIIEDTQELPIEALRKIGYNIQGMKVRGALMHASNEMSADEGIRTSLRFGDSCLIIGEIRSLEARALFEAMRVGSMANVVAGTIHGADPYSVFDRVVNDLNVPRTSFKAADVIIVANPVKSADGLTRVRRVLRITEVRKHWENDPLNEKGFMDLMVYDAKTDELKPTEELLNGESEVLKAIAGEVKDYVGNWEGVWGNILLRGRIKSMLIEYADRHNLPELLEAGFVVASNDSFHEICNKVRERSGFVDSRKVIFEWEDWLKRYIKRKM
ncbi:MAG TPA: type II/IV secretion system ATPase subunit [Candidatus Nanoarchaeia archaeon]|nr:type II/IV secretion system ATPase subunit [Candidatus Nanoarchaeia archaeon]